MSIICKNLVSYLGAAIKIFFIKFLEKKKYEEALHIVEESCNDPILIKARDERLGFVERSFQYRYHRIKRTGFTLLHYAVLYKRVDMIRILIQNGAGIAYI